MEEEEKIIEEELSEYEKELSEYEKELGDKLGKAYMMLFTKKGLKHFEDNIEKIFIGVKFIKTIKYDKAKEQAQGIGDNRQVLIYNKVFKTYCVLSLYGLYVNWELSQNPQNYIIYQLW